MQGRSSETWEERRARYLELATQAIRSAVQSNTPELRKGYLSIARSWMEMARLTESSRE